MGVSGLCISTMRSPTFCPFALICGLGLLAPCAALPVDDGQKEDSVLAVFSQAATDEVQEHADELQAMTLFAQTRATSRSGSPLKCTAGNVLASTEDSCYNAAGWHDRAGPSKELNAKLGLTCAKSAGNDCSWQHCGCFLCTPYGSKSLMIKHEAFDTKKSDAAVASLNKALPGMKFTRQGNSRHWDKLVLDDCPSKISELNSYLTRPAPPAVVKCSAGGVVTSADKSCYNAAGWHDRAGPLTELNAKLGLTCAKSAGNDCSWQHCGCFLCAGKSLMIKHEAFDTKKSDAAVASLNKALPGMKFPRQGNSRHWDKLVLDDCPSKISELNS